MITSQWRQYAAPIIEKVLSETRGQDEKAIKKALRDAYPFGERKNHPYQVWCSEIRRQCWLGKPKKKAVPVNTSLSLF